MSEVRYTDQHEWIRLDGEEATVGITKYAAESLGDVVFVELPANGTEVDLMVRGKPLPAKVAPMPFVPNRYRR